MGTITESNPSRDKDFYLAWQLKAVLGPTRLSIQCVVWALSHTIQHLRIRLTTHHTVVLRQTAQLFFHGYWVFHVLNYQNETNSTSSPGKILSSTILNQWRTYCYFLLGSKDLFRLAQVTISSGTDIMIPLSLSFSEVERRFRLKHSLQKYSLTKLDSTHNYNPSTKDGGKKVARRQILAYFHERQQSASYVMI